MREHDHSNNNSEDSDYIYGRWPVLEALQAGRVLKVMMAKNSHGPQVDEIMVLAKQKRVPFLWLERQKLDHLVGERHQGVVAQAAPLSFNALEDILNRAVQSRLKGPCILFLDGIVDPQNLGAILRSAYFFGVPGVVIPKWRAASLSGAVIRVSAGAAQFIPVAQGSNLPTAMETATKKGIWLIGADMEGE